MCVYTVCIGTSTYWYCQNCLYSKTNHSKIKMNEELFACGMSTAAHQITF